MSFAYVYVHGRNGQVTYKCVRTNQIKKFNSDLFISEKNKGAKSQVPYVLNQDDGTRDTCQVLAVGDSVADVQAISQRQRHSVPKLSYSVIDGVHNNLSTSDSSDSDREKKERKKSKNLKRQNSNKVENEIVEKYKTINSVVSSEEEIEDDDMFNERRGVDGQDSFRVIEKKNNIQPSFYSTPVKKKKQEYSVIPTFVDLNKENRCLTNISPNPGIDLEQKLKSAYAEVKHWKEKYEQLLFSESYPLTEKTGQKIINLVDKFATNQQFYPTLDKAEDSTEHEVSHTKKRSISSSSLKEKNYDNNSDKSDDKQINPDSFSQVEDELKVNSLIDKNFKEPAECAKSIIRSLWSAEELQERVVRKTLGNNKKVLTPEKVTRGKTIYAQWLKTRGYLKTAKTLELDRWNTHMSRVIECALKIKKKQLLNKTKITENKGVMNSQMNSDDTEKEKES